MTSTSRHTVAAVTLLVLLPLVGDVGGQSATPAAAFFQYPYQQLARQVWPGDFNGDGHTDLIAGAAYSAGAPSNMYIATGRGDGTFNAPRLLGVAAEPLAVADVNGDGKMDVVVLTASGVGILPGLGTGSFGAVRMVTNEALGENTAFALVADFNADGKRDLVVPSWSGVVHVYPGNGDFTFGPPSDVAVDTPASAISADFNGDGRRDFAVVQVCCSILVFLNQGGLIFSPTEIPMGSDMGDIAAGDLNGDGRPDLVVTLWSAEGVRQQDGRIATLLNTGSGSFAPPVFYTTPVPNPNTVVVGDFTRDGVLDVATGNQSVYDDPDLGTQLWDSITIWKGNGAGAITPSVTFSLGDASVGQQHQLNTNDLNGDGFLDLISSPGVVLLNAPPIANRAPTVFAGPDETLDSYTSLILNGVGQDPDRHWVTFTWTDETGQVVAHTPTAAPYGTVAGAPIGTHTFTLTVTDVFGATASDSVTVVVRSADDQRGVYISRPSYNEQLVVDQPYQVQWDTAGVGITRFDLSVSSNGGQVFTSVTACTNLPATARSCVVQSPGPLGDNNLFRVIATYSDGFQWIALSPRFSIVTSVSVPLGLNGQDIGAVQAAGSATFDGTTYTVKGSGADIWGTADEFYYAYRYVDSNFVATVHVSSVQNISDWTKVGLMVRTGLGAGDRHVSLFTTPGSTKGYALQTRQAVNGTSTQVARGGAGGPAWLRLIRNGPAVIAYVRDNQPMSPWVYFGSASIGTSGYVLLGFAVSSHVDGRLATGTFDNFTVDPLLSWTTQNIGAVGVSGSFAATDDVRFRLSGSGADIWGTADAFYFRYVQWDGDGTVTARIWSIQNTNAWAKAGVMVRESLAANSKQVMAIVSAGKGLAMQYRAATGGTSANAALASGTAPKWIRLTRKGDTFTAATSTDYLTWTPLGTVTVPMNRYVYVGVPVTSHNNSVAATADVDDLSARP